MNLQELAQETAGYFETATRDNGESYVRTKDGTPEWVDDLTYAAHGDMGPDDWRYKFIEEALIALAEDEDPQLDADIYTHELTAWLASRADRYSYVDEAVEELGHGKNLIEDLMAGQWREKDEVLSAVRSFLENRLEELGDESEDGDEE